MRGEGVLSDSLVLRQRTPLLFAKRLGEVLGVPNLHLKLEGSSPTGGHKFWLAQAACKHARQGQAKGLFAGSCGHYGVALAWLCSRLRIPAFLAFPQGTARLSNLPEWIKLDLHTSSYDAAVALSRKEGLLRGYLDVNPGIGLGDLGLEAYGPVAEEIVAQLGGNPSAILCPAGNGTTIAGIHRGFRRLGSVPRHFGVTVRQNVLAPGYVAARGIDWDVEPLRSDSPLDQVPCLEALQESGGAIAVVDKAALLEAQQLILRHAGLRIDASSAAPLAALASLVEAGQVEREDVVVAIVTSLSVKEGFR